MADPLSVAASIAGLISIADVVFTRLVKYGKAVKNAEKDLKELTKDVNLLGGSLDSLSRLARALEDGSFNRNLHMDYIDDCNETLEEMKEKLGKVEADSAKGKLFWPGRSSRLKAWREDISRHQGMINAALSADTLQALLKILSHEDRQMEEIHSEIRGITNIVSRVDKESRRSKVQDFFLKCNPQGNYEMSLQLRHPRTGLWLINRLPQFQHWLSAPKAHLWLKGMPGAGKTVLAASIIEAVLGKSTGSIATAFFFCDYKNPVTQSPETILGVLAYQLSIQNDNAYKALVQYYDELHPKQGLPKSPDISSLKALLHSILEMYDHVYLIVDGLDECGDMTEDVIDVLVDTFDEADNVSVALLSRDEDGIRDRLIDCCVSIEVAAHKHDIMEYVTAQIQERIRVGKLRAYDPELKAEVIQGLVDGAKGMFRWVSCQLDHLKDCVSDQDCRDALLALPPTLDETYARILRRVPKGKQRLVQLALQFVAYASPKLTIRQLREALSVPERPTLLDQRQIVQLNAITKYCSSLVRESSDGQYLEFSHFSVQEFLKDTSLQDPDLAAFGVSKSVCHRLLAAECLKFLQLRNFYRLDFDPETEADVIKIREDEFPFYSYAARHWPSLARDTWDDTQVVDLAKALFNPKKSPYFTSWSIEFSNCIGDIYINEITEDYASPNFTPLHMAAALSLAKLCSFLVEKGADVNMKSEAGSPLQCAVQGLLFMSADWDGAGSSLADFAGGYHGSLATDDTIMCLYRAGASLDTTSTQIYVGESLLEVAFRSTLLSGRLCVATMLINLGIPIREKDLDRANEMFQRFNGYSPGQYEEKYTLSLQPFIESLDQRTEKSPATLRLCSLAWEAAIRAKIDFTFDVMAIDTRVTLTLEDLEKQAIAAIVGFNPQALQKIMSDPRLQAPKVSDKDGNTLLHMALMGCGYNVEKTLEITRLLLNAGCDILRTNDDKQQPLHVWDNHLIEKEEVTWPQDPHREAFHELMQMITEVGATCASRDARGKNALHHHIISSSHLQAILDAQSTQNIMAASEAIDDAGFTPFALSLKLGFLASASILVKTLEMTPSTMTSPIPILGLAVNANATEIFDLLIPLTFKLDLDLNENPLHHVGPGATASNIRRLKSLYPDACTCRLHGKTPFESYLERCLGKDAAAEVDQDVMDELSMLETCEGDVPAYAKVWERFAQLAADIKSEGIVASAGMSLLRLGYMRIFERENGISGIIPILSSFSDFETTFNFPPISADLICLILQQTERKTDFREEQQILRLLAATARSLNFEITTLLLTNGVSVHRRGYGLSVLEDYCSNPPDASVAPKAEQMFDLLLEHAEKRQLNECNTRGDGLAAIHLLGRPGAEWMVDKLVRRGADPNLRVKSQGHRTALVHHLLNRRPSYALSLLSNGADPSMEGDNGWDAVFTSALMGYDLVLAEILALDTTKSIPSVKWETSYLMNSYRKDTIILRHENCTGLHAGADEGSVEVIKFYLDNGLITSIDAKTNHGWTDLHAAAYEGHPEVIKALCGYGADVNARCKAGRSPLHLAADNSQLASAEALIEAEGKPFADFSGCKPSFYVDVSENPNLKRLLLSVENKDSKEGPSDDLVGLEAESGPALSTICAAAILENQTPKLELLAAKGFDFESPLNACQGCSGLIYAIILGRVDIIQWLLQHGAAITRPVYCGEPRRTGLHLALERVSLAKTIPNCLRNFAVNGGHFLGQSPSLIYAALARDNVEGLSHLLTYMAKTSHEIHRQVINKRCTNTAHSLITGFRRQQRVSGDVQNLLAAALGELDDQGITPLIHAVRNEKHAAVQMLLDFGANVNGIARSSLETSLHEAVRVGNVELASLLIARGSDVELRNRNGSTPLALAAAHNEDLKIVHALLDANADRNVFDHLNDSILDDISYDSQDSCGIFAESVRAGVNPHKPTRLGLSAFHQAMMVSDFASYILNSDFRLEDSIPYNWGFLGNSPVWIDTAYRFFRKKYRAETLKTFANMTISGRWSPLCRFASRGEVKPMENLLELNCPLDYEGCPFGSALMAACVDGRMASVAFLVRHGASLTYHGPNGYRSAYMAASNQKRILDWLLVGRFVDQNKLTDSCDSPDTRENCRLLTWGGPRKAEVVISGILERWPGESSQVYWSRLLREKRSWRGKVPPLARDRRTIRPSSLIPGEKVRVHPDGYNSSRSMKIHGNGDSTQEHERDMRSQTIPKMVFDGLLWYTPWTA